MQIHPWASSGFGRSAESYERARPGYPAEVASWLAERTALASGATVVDVGAGTGKFTRLLAATGAHVVAVEPVPEMRRWFPRDVAAEIVDGSAERIPMPDGSADLVTAAESFHWFRGDEALREIHRVLRPGESLALIWNRLDLTGSLEAAFDAAVERHRGHPPVRDAGDWLKALERTTLFAERDVRQFENVQELDADGIVDRAASESSIAILPDERRDAALAEIRALAGRLRRIVLRYETVVRRYERRTDGE